MSNNSIIKQVKNIISKQKNRPNWDEYFMTNALLMSSRSSCTRLKVGCVVVKNNHVIASSYNGFLSGARHISKIIDNHEQNTCHAEQNAIADAAKRGVIVDTATVYVTHYPCINCAKIMAQSGIKEIKYYEDYNNNILVKELFEEIGITIIKLK